MENETLAFSEIQEKLDSDVDKTALNALMANLGEMAESAQKQAASGLKPDEFAANEKYSVAIVAAAETFQAYWVTKNM